MKITLDINTNEITVPKTFFATISKENEIIEKAGGTGKDYRTRIREAMEEALSNTDKYLTTKK